MKRLVNVLLAFLPFIFVFFASLYPARDPDLGWHLKYGEYFFQHGTILRENIFSTDMPAYLWANTSWVVDLITYAIFSAAGFIGLTVFGAFIVTCTFAVYSRWVRLTSAQRYFVFPLLLYLVSPINNPGFRGQQVSLLFVGVLLWVLDRYKEKPTSRIYLLIPFFILWGNLHGLFIMGIGIFFIWLFVHILLYIVRNRLNQLGSTVYFQKKQLQQLILAGIGSAVAVLLNPFGSAVYTTAIAHFGDPRLLSIAEYLPFETTSYLWFNQMIVTFPLLLWFIAKITNGTFTAQLPYLVLFLLMFAAGIWVRRYVWTMFYLSVPLLQVLTTTLNPPKFAYSRYVLLGIGFTLLSMVFVSKWPFTQFWGMNWQTYCAQEYIQCSPEAAQYLVEHQLPGPLLTLYHYGGWLIWNYPTIKPSIDGRMHLWKDKDGYSAFNHYYELEQNWKDIDQSEYNVVFMSPTKPLYTRLKDLVQQGTWRIVYEDDMSGIFMRVQSI